MLRWAGASARHGASMLASLRHDAGLFVLDVPGSGREQVAGRGVPVLPCLPSLTSLPLSPPAVVAAVSP